MATAVSITYSADWDALSEFPRGDSDEDRRAIISAQEWQVREQWFAANISLHAGSFLVEYVRAPLIDFAMAFRYSLDELAADGLSSFSVSGGSRLDMLRKDNLVEIGQGGLIARGIEFADVLGACVHFRRRLVDELTSKFPDLLLNGLIEFLFRESGLREKDRERFRRHTRAVKLRTMLS